MRWRRGRGEAVKPMLKMKLHILRRNPVKTLSQIPLAIRGMIERQSARDARRERNRKFFRQFLGIEQRNKTRSGRLGDRELVESNLPLR